MAKSKTKKTPLPWPKLSETLPHKSRTSCNRCNAGGQKRDVSFWIECDDEDRRQPVFIALCGFCADELIEPHPRLYIELLSGECMPGAMRVCDDCKLRDGLRCTSPDAKFNGGQGLVFDPQPASVHLCRSKASGWHFFMANSLELARQGVEQQCSGKVVRDAT